MVLVWAIVQVESGGDIYAWRVEPHYRYLMDVSTGKPFRAQTAAEVASERAPQDFPYINGLSSRDTEWWGQQASWGPMQIMGAVAREYGFRGHFPELCGEHGIDYGCRHLAWLCARFLRDGDYRRVAAAFNAGSLRYTDDGKFVNQVYVDKVAARGGFN